MNDTPKRRFWQIHLSTAVVLMVASSALVGLNLATRTELWITFDMGPEPTNVYFYEQMVYFFSGWPVECRINKNQVSSRQTVEFPPTIVRFPTPSFVSIDDILRVWPDLYPKLKLERTFVDPGLLSSRWIISGVLVNIATGAGILSLIAVSCELLLRRRA